MTAKATESMEKTYSVCECNRLYSEETLHPMAGVIDLDKPCAAESLRTDCYAVTLTDSEQGGGTGYGRMSCDYTSAAMLFCRPGCDIGKESLRSGQLLLFHPRLLQCTCLGKKISDYTFFRYSPREALHLSCREERQARRCVSYIGEELQWGVDKFSKALLCNKIELLLNYCMRFYCRQFTTRHDVCADALGRMTEIIDRHFAGGKAADGHIPTAGGLAARLGMSPAYLADMVRHITGLGMAEYIAARRMVAAKSQLLCTGRSVAAIADGLGFCSETYFRALFRKITGLTPEEYRHE